MKNAGVSQGDSLTPSTSGGEKETDREVGCISSLGIALLAVVVMAGWAYLVASVADTFTVHPAWRPTIVGATAGVAGGIVFGSVRHRAFWLRAILTFGVSLATGLVLYYFIKALGERTPHSEVIPGFLLAGAFALVVAGLIQWQLPSHKPAALGAIALVVLTAAAVALAGAYGAREIAAVEADILPAVEQLLAEDLLVTTAPVDWDQPELRLRDTINAAAPSRRGGGGQVFVCTRGRMQKTGVKIHFFSDSPTRESGQPGQAEGLGLNGMAVDLPQPQRALTDTETHDPAAVQSLLLDMGVRLEVVERLQVSGAHDPVAEYRGIQYTFDWNNLSNSSYFTRVYCTGIRSTTQ